MCARVCACGRSLDDSRRTVCVVLKSTLELTHAQSRGDGGNASDSEHEGIRLQFVNVSGK